MIKLTLQGRLGRKEYGYWSLLLTLIVTLSACIVTMMNNTLVCSTFLGRLVFGILALSFIPVIAWALILATTLIIRRLHDFDWNGWTALLVIPYACLILLVGTFANEAVDLRFALTAVQFLALLPQLVLLLMPGTEGLNRFGGEIGQP